jgi:succinate--hydroxymethylglutarate CoA-transferase
MILADMGAEVIKVERPGVGDETRQWGPPFTQCGESTYFLSVNRGKRSLAVDIASAEGLAVVQQLAMEADVLLENFLPGKLEKLGLGWEALSARNPALVYASITGYGATGPYADRGGYDVIASAVGGLMEITGPADGEPCKAGVALTDLSTGLYAHGAILAALLARHRTGVGQRIECSLLETQVASLVNVASAYLNAGADASRQGTAHASIVPYQAFGTADGHLVVAAMNDRQFVRLCERMELSELPVLEKYRTNPARVKHRVELLAILQERLSSRSSAEWLDALDGSGLAYGPINKVGEVFADPQVLHREMVMQIQHPTAGAISLPGLPVKMCGGAGGDASPSTRLPTPPPLLGQHTREVLTELGYTADQVAALEAAGTVQTTVVAELIAE